MVKKNALITGRQPLIEAIEAGRAIDKILFQRNVSGESIGDIRRLAKKYHIPITLVPPEKLSSMTKINHQGVIAFASVIEYIDLQTVIDFVVTKGEIPLFVMIDGITDTRNIGAIARSALVCGAQAMIIPDKGVGQLNEEALKSSAGALEKINVCRVHSLVTAINTLHLNGIRIFTSEIAATKRVSELDFSEPCCIVMGSEDNGVQNHVSRASDEHFTIPMTGNFDSFNVSVAAGIILYEAMKKRLYG
jgi:23S rRNA (guanosine2251-2'-O)-methyltransferase